jgi:hypothetical protein
MNRYGKKKESVPLFVAKGFHRVEPLGHQRFGSFIDSDGLKKKKGRRLYSPA